MLTTSRLSGGMMGGGFPQMSIIAARFRFRNMRVLDSLVPNPSPVGRCAPEACVATFSK